MKAAALEVLMCPFCAGPFEVNDRRPAGDDEIESGILECDCSEFPLVGGIAIFRREGRIDTMKQTVDSAIHRGPDVRLLLDRIRAGQPDRALMLLLAPPPRSSRNLRRASELVPGRLGRPLLRRALREWDREADAHRGLFLGDPESTSAEGVLEHYGKSWFAHWDFFLHRFAQPRHLSSLSVASIAPDSPKPVLDHACGMGHTLHYWTTRYPGHLFIGTDRNFFQLYAARRWVAPAASYVCTDADVALPFRSGAFGSAFCMDAFHLFKGRLTCASELARITGDDGFVGLLRIGNGLVPPHEGLELSPAGYQRLFEGLEVRLVAEKALLDRYLQGLGPALAAPVAPEAVASEKWISVVASRRKNVFRDYGPLGEWPHGVGRLAVNPLYVERRRGASGDVDLELVFPSEWYAFENAESKAYLPERLTMTAQELADITAGRRTPKIQEWIRSTVVFGVPDRYLRRDADRSQRPTGMVE